MFCFGTQLTKVDDGFEGFVTAIKENFKHLNGCPWRHSIFSMLAAMKCFSLRVTFVSHSCFMRHDQIRFTLADYNKMKQMSRFQLD